MLTFISPTPSEVFYYYLFFPFRFGCLEASLDIPTLWGGKMVIVAPGKEEATAPIDILTEMQNPYSKKDSIRVK